MQEVGMQRKIQVLPTVEAWRGGTCLDTAKGGEPAKVMEMLDRHFDEIKDSGGGITTVQVAEAVFVAGVVWALCNQLSSCSDVCFFVCVFSYSFQILGTEQAACCAVY
jgi:hypothetical protein